MRIWILQTGEPLHCDNLKLRPMRAMNLANSLVENGHEVLLWSSAFFHQQKLHRTRSFTSLSINSNLKICLIPSIGYTSNFSFMRLLDHAQLALNLLSALRSTTQLLPDIVFVGYPPIESAFIISRWLRSKSIPYVLDVKDLWPQLFVEAFPRPLHKIVRFILHPYFVMAKATIRDADCVVSMTESFLTTISSFAGRLRKPLDSVLPLSPKLDDPLHEDLNPSIEWWRQFGIDLSHNRRLIFVGSLSWAFDFSTLSEALLLLSQSKVFVEVIICGRGGDETNIKSLFKEVPNVYFPGWIDQPKRIALMNNSLATLAPYKSTANFINNFPNKIIDSLSYGLPVITGLRGEVQSFLAQSQAGIFCEDTSVSWAQAIFSILNDNCFVQKLSSNASEAFAANFTSEVIYGEFIKKLELLAHG